MTEAMIETNATAPDAASRRRDLRDLRRANDFLCLWRLCGSAACRRARSCRGRPHLCAKRHRQLLPQAVHDFFLSFLAAQYAGLSFEEFRAEMEGREETNAYFAWRETCGARRG
jgi:hypothetical protein